MPPKTKDIPSERRPAKRTPKAPLAKTLRHCKDWLRDPDVLSQKAAMDFLKSVKDQDPEKKDILVETFCYAHGVRREMLEQLREVKELLVEDDFLTMAECFRMARSRPETRAAAAQALALSDSSLVYDIMWEQAGEEKDVIALSYMVDALWQMEARKTADHDFGTLLEFIEHEDIEVRKTVVMNLKEYGNMLSEDDINRIGNLLQNEDVRLRLTGIAALEEVNRPDITAYRLMEKLDEEKNEPIKKKLLEVLRRMRISWSSGSMQRSYDITLKLRKLKTDPAFEIYEEQLDDILDDTLPVDVPPNGIKPKIKES